MYKSIMRYLLLIALCTTMAVVSACSTNKIKESPQAQLEKEINRWQSFHMEGIAEVNVSAFVIRKYFICQKYSHSLQFDLVNSGLLGAEPTPLVSIKADSLLRVDSPYKDMIQAMLIRAGLKQVNFTQYLDFKTMFKEKIPEITSTGKTTIGNYEFVFQKNMQLVQIKSHDNKQNITIQYRKGNPNIIIADIERLAKVRMQVEQFVDTSCCDSLVNLSQDQTQGEE